MSLFSHQPNTILDSIIRYYEEDNIHFRQSEDSSVLKAGFRGQNGNYDLYAQAKEEQHQALFVSYCPTKVPSSKEREVAEFLTRANNGLILGNFEMDFEDGRVRYKTSVDLEDGHLTTNMVKRLVMTNLSMMDKYLPGLMSVIYAGASPIAALAQVEGLTTAQMTEAEVAMN